MNKLQYVHCPNCGKRAYRKYIGQRPMTETACPTCDYYLLVNCSLVGQVVECYAPGIRMH